MFRIFKPISRPNVIAGAVKGFRLFATQAEKAIAERMVKPTGNEKVILEKAKKPGSYSTVVDGAPVTVQVGNYPEEALYTVKVGGDKNPHTVAVEVAVDDTPSHWDFK